VFLAFACVLALLAAGAPAQAAVTGGYERAAP